MLLIILSIIVVIYIILTNEKLNRQLIMLGNISDIFSYLLYFKKRTY